jgi:hypothetical protein
VHPSTRGTIDAHGAGGGPSRVLAAVPRNASSVVVGLDSARLVRTRGVPRGADTTGPAR